MKIKNIFSAGRMNKDFDERIVPKGEYIDALNVRVVNSADGDAGAIQSTEGNTQLSNISVTGSPRVIGCVTDESTERIYWFVVNNVGHSYVFEYDTQSNFQRTILEDTRAAATNVLKFDVMHKVYGNVIYNVSKKENILLFTDGLNSPKLVNIERAISYGPNGFEEDDISLIRKPPFEAPKVTPFFTNDKTENSIKENFFAFAYRYKYLDGQYSALSSFTNYQFHPSPFKLDFGTMENKGMVNLYNGYNIQYNTGDKRVTDIDLCFKFAKQNTVYVIESINKADSDFGDDMTKTYQFTNKKIFKALPGDELFRIFDDVPLTAKTQDFIKDRLIFGNTTSQYDLRQTNDDKTPPIKIDYNVELESKDIDATQLTTTLSNNNQNITIDVSNIIFEVNSELVFGVDLTSPEDTYLSAAFGNGSASFAAGAVLTATYSGVNAFVNSDDFAIFLQSLNSNFAAQATVTNPTNLLSTEFGEFTLVSSSTTSIVLKAPKITFTIDTTPADNTDNTNPGFQLIRENQFTFQSTTVASFAALGSTLSLKSNRSFEFGITYLDEFGRYTSVLLPKESVTSTSEIFVPVGNSMKQNRAKITINSRPPFWANRYKFFVKTNKEVYYNLFGTIFYEDGVYRWISLEGNNIGKVEPGTMLLVKRDDDGALGEEVKCKVLEVVDKKATDELTAGQSWIEGNTDGSGEPIVEKAGLHMKIKPSKFSMDFDPNNFISYDQTDHKSRGKKTRRTKVFLPSLPRNYAILSNSNQDDSTFGFLQRINAAGTAYNDLKLSTGSRIDIDWSLNGFNADPSFNYEKGFTVENDYESTATVNAFELWADAETNWAKTQVTITTSGGVTQNVNQFTVPSQNNENEEFTFYLYKDTGNANDANKTRWTMRIEPSETAAFLERNTLNCKIDIILLNGVIVFETDPQELNSEVYYETDETFRIESGFHQGSEQNQGSSQPAIVKLNFGNCFSFANGVESISIRDDRFTPFMDLDTRPNINLLEGYEALNSTNKLIYSGSFNENSNYNSLNEFNASRGITKFMDMKFGSVQRVYSREDDVIVFQEDRVSRVLFGKGVINQPDGTGSLTRVEQVLGQDVPFTGEYGIGKSPESFAAYENSLYFADPFRGAVLRLGQNGITPISAQGMKSYFKENLYANRNNFNPGGYDPRNNQYVITPGESVKTPIIPVTTCNSQLDVRVSKTLGFSYVLNIGETSGTHTIALTITGGSVDVSVDYNGTTTTTTVSGSGNVTFSANPLDDDTASITVITTNDSSNPSASVVSIHNQCPVPETMSVTILVVNDAYKSNQTIVNRFKNSSANVFNEALDTFDVDTVTRFETFSGPMGSTNIPDNGDTVTISSLKLAGVHTGDFNPCNDLGYWVTAAVNPTAADILTNANFTGNTTQTETSSQEENTLQFTFNRSSTSENLYLVYDYRDQLPVLVDDSITGISNGGSSIINVVNNDTLPSAYTLTIETPPTNGTATIVSGSPTTSITYTHTAGNALTDEFTYKVTRGGTCSQVARVTTQALAISSGTYIYIYFDGSGSMNNTLTELQAMRTNSLKSVLQDLYATGGTASSGNTNSATNGSDAYDSHVTIVYSDGGTWSNERTWAAFSDSDVNDFLLNGHNDFPSDATNVVFLVFQDEAEGGTTNQARYHTSSYNGLIQGNHSADIASLRSRINTLNSSNNNFYRGVLFQVDGLAAFKSYVQAVENGTGNFSGTNGLSDLASSPNNYIGFTYDIEDSNNNDASAPYKPGTTDRFDKWEYYYLYHVTNELKNLGFDEGGALGWPRILDDG